NDHAERDPRDWTLKGSADGKEWTTLDTRSGESFAEPFQTMVYHLDASAVAEYRHFRIEFTKYGSGGILQLADRQFSTGDSDPPHERARQDRGLQRSADGQELPTLETRSG